MQALLSAAFGFEHVANLVKAAVSKSLSFLDALMKAR